MKSLNKSLSLRVLLLSFLCLFNCKQPFLQAQERKSLTLEVSVPPVQKLIIVETRSFPNIDSDDFNRGYIELIDAVTLSVSSNVPWRVVIFMHRANLYATPKSVKPVDSFQWRKGHNKYQSISPEPVVILEGSGCVKDFTFTLDYRLKLSWQGSPPGRLDFQPEFRIEPGNLYLFR